MVFNLNKIIIFGTIFFTIFGTAVEAKEQICGNLSTYVYMQNANPPKVGCLYAYNPYDRMSPLTLRVQQVINSGILVSADTNYYGNYFSNPKTIFIQTSKQFVDDQLMRDKEIVKYMGVYDYITVLGARKRVYKFYRYGKYEIEKNVEKSSLENYGFIEHRINQQKIISNKNILNTENIDKYFNELKFAKEQFENNIDKTPSEENNIKFKAFLSTYKHIIEEINNDENNPHFKLTIDDANGTDLYDEWTPRAKELYKRYKDNGFEISFSSGGFSVFPNEDYLSNFYKYLTPAYKEWLIFKDESENDYWDGCLLERKEIVKRILYIENFAIKNPTFIDSQEVNSYIKKYLESFFVYSENFTYETQNNNPFFTVGTLTKDFIEALKSFPSSYYDQNTKHYKQYKHNTIINNYYKIAKANSYKQTENLYNQTMYKISQFKLY